VTKPVIGFAGMTHLGLISGVCAAEKGFRVTCFDPDFALISSLDRGEPPVSEPRLSELLRRNKRRLQFTTDATSLSACAVVYVAPDVPTDDAGVSDLAPVHAMLETVFAAARNGAAIVVLSQVPPGFTRRMQRPGKFLHCQVETLIFGRAIERALQPERYIVGCADPSRPLPAQYASFLEAHGCPILPMRYESAELAKISVNMCLVASISAANTLAELCERVGADWSEIAPALKLDKRIGQFAYLAPGLGIAGGNLERDLATLSSLADAHGTDAGVVRACIANSRHRRDWSAHTIKEVLLNRRPQAVVAIWGLAYKENTHSVKNSPSLATIAQLPGTALRLHDPVVSAAVSNHPNATAASDPIEAVRGADALMILTPWPQYREIAPTQIAAAMRGRIVLDPYAVLDEKAATAAGLQVQTMGRPAPGATHA
jgi:UDPglucose 6-dehydrogenase